MRLAATILAATAAAILSAQAPERRERTISVAITAPAGGWTSERVVKVEGRVGGEIDSLALLVNGVFHRLRPSAEFSRAVVLTRGENTITVVASGAAGSATDTVRVFSLAEAKDVHVTLTWDTDGTDVDLWVFDAAGEKCFYSHKQTACGGSLDTDVTDGFGPETFTLSHAPAGRYRVAAHFYSGGSPTLCRVTLVLRQGTPEEERKTRTFLLHHEGELHEVCEFFFEGATK